MQFKAAPQVTFDLPPEERVWRGAVALLAAVATAVALYAALVSLTPRTMAADDTIPFTAFGNQPLGNGRVLTRARFEVWPTLGAAVAIAIALAAYGLLRRHWRAAGLERHAPDRPLAGTRRVLRLGVGLFALFLLHQLLAHTRAAAAVSYIPVIGGCFELLMLVRFWDAALEARQTNRPLAREPLLWLGLALAFFPPTYSMALLIGPLLTTRRARGRSTLDLDDLGANLAFREGRRVDVHVRHPVEHLAHLRGIHRRVAGHRAGYVGRDGEREEHRTDRPGRSRTVDVSFRRGRRQAAEDAP